MSWWNPFSDQSEPNKFGIKQGDIDQSRAWALRSSKELAAAICAEDKPGNFRPIYSTDMHDYGRHIEQPTKEQFLVFILGIHATNEGLYSRACRGEM